MIVYDVTLLPYEGSNIPETKIFYDTDRKKALKAMREYKAKHGFSIKTNRGEFCISGIMLKERESTTNEILKETAYHELFDIFGNLKESDTN